MPTNKQEREQARRRLQQQLERRREAEARRRKSLIAVTVIATLVVIAVVVGLVIGLGGGSDTPSASGSSSAGASPTASAAGTTGPCAYKSAPAAGNTNRIDVGLPPDPDPTPTTNRTLKLLTNLGEVDVALDGAAAPCNVQSVSYLAQKGFYNGTPCHRLVTEGIFVLQCGDPSGTGSGGPTYEAPDENLASADYSEGVVAMANSGPNTNSSQFFIMTKDSNQGLQKSYTVIGKVTAGLNFVQQVAAAGSDNSNAQGDGKPNTPLMFTAVTVSPELDLATSSSSAAPTDSGAASTDSGSAPPVSGVSSPEPGLNSGSPVTT